MYKKIDWEERYRQIKRLHTKHKGNVAAMAEDMAISRPRMYALCREMGLPYEDKTDFLKRRSKVIKKLHKANNGNISAMARDYGVSRQRMHQICREHDLVSLVPQKQAQFVEKIRKLAPKCTRQQTAVKLGVPYYTISRLGRRHNITFKKC